MRESGSVATSQAKWVLAIRNPPRASLGQTPHSTCVVFSFSSMFLVFSTRLFAAYSEGDSNPNSCSMRWLRFYRKMASHEPKPLPHTN